VSNHQLITKDQPQFKKIGNIRDAAHSIGGREAQQGNV
jgi:hypothetical protein